MLDGSLFLSLDLFLVMIFYSAVHWGSAEGIKLGKVPGEVLGAALLVSKLGV